jgi:two-component system capsular synthesis sensor histidine kinase RcsC
MGQLAARPVGSATASRDRETAAGLGALRIRVSDTGRGIAPEQQRRLFETYIRSSEESVASAGLGLAITGQLVALLGGELRVESAPGSGSVFEVVVPFMAGRNGERPFEGNVLIVEDSEVQRQHMVSLCEELGVMTTAVGSLAELREMDLDPPFDAVLLDFNLGDGTAIDAAEWLKAHQVNAPITVVTGHAYKSVEELCVAAGVREVIPKPLSLAAAIGVFSKR